MSDYKKLGNEHLTNAVCLADKIIHLNIKFRVAEEIGVCPVAPVVGTQMPGTSVDKDARGTMVGGMQA